MLSRSIRVALFFVVAACIVFAYSKIDARAQDLAHETGLPVVQEARARDDTPSLSHFDTNIGAPSSVAAIVYSQPPNGAFLLQRSSQFGYGQYGSDYDQYVWDNFTLNSTQAITEIVWRGVYNSGGSVGGAVSDFVVSVYTSTAGNTQPDHLNGLLVQYTLGGNAGETPPWTSNGVSASIHDYTFTLPAPFTATAGIKYWVQIEGIQNGPPDWGIVAGTGGNGLHFYAVPGIGDFYFNIASGDAAFTLLGPVAPIAGLSATNNSPSVLGQATTFTATVSVGSGVSYAWNFGDQTTGNGQVVSHIYTGIGSYTAVVTASNSLGSLTATTAVTITDAPISGLTASNDGPTLLGIPTALSASVATGSNVVYEWSLGDGGLGNGQVLSHTYPHAGLFTATVTATNNVSGPLTKTTVVEIVTTEQPIEGLSATNDSPTLLGGMTTLSASVTAGSTVTYTWNMGDGQVRTGKVVTHYYTGFGIFTAIVTATNSLGQASATTPVTITAPYHTFLPLCQVASSP